LPTNPLVKLVEPLLNLNSTHKKTAPMERSF
jgi:hypothetical protein